MENRLVDTVNPDAYGIPGHWPAWTMIYIYFFFFLTALFGFWDLSSMTRDQTQALGSESTQS